MKSKVLANEHIIRRYQKRSWYMGMIIFLILVIFTGRMRVLAWESSVIKPCPDNCQNVVSNGFPHPLSSDQLIDLYSVRFGKTKWEQLRTKTLLHFMLLTESAYGNTNKCGDSGLACGPLQFHEATYVSYRKQMLSKGLTVGMGSRFDMADSIETAAYIINQGGEDNWGPVSRGQIKI